MMTPIARTLTCVLARMLACITLSSLLAGCATGPRGPYDPTAEARRDPRAADRLNTEAMAIFEAEPGRAERLLREALTADLYHGPAHNNLGILFLDRGLLYEAAQEFEWARKLMPEHPDPRMNLALTLERAGRTDEALAGYAGVLESSPGHLPTIQALARLQVRTGRADARTDDLLGEIAFRSSSPRWRQWAREQIAGRSEEP